MEHADSLPAILHASSDAKDIQERLSLPAAITLNLMCIALLFKDEEALTNRMLILNSFLFLLSRSGTIIFISKLQLPPDSEQVTSTKDSTMQCLGVLSMPMLALLTLLLVIMPPNLETSSMKVIGHAMAQAAWWFAIVTVIRFQSMNMSANLDTIGFSIQLAVAGSSMSSVAKVVLAMLLSIGQSFIAIRPGTAIHRVIYMLVALFVLGLWICKALGFTTTVSNNTKSSSGHPVEYLVTHSRAKLDDMLSRQSKMSTKLSQNISGDVDGSLLWASINGSTLLLRTIRAHR